MLKLRSKELLLSQFGKTNELRAAYESNPALMEQFIDYVLSSFAWSKSALNKTRLVSSIKRATSDMEFITACRKLIEGVSDAQLLAKEESYYQHAINAKLNSMSSIGLTAPMGSYLDVGTERGIFLDAVQAKFKCRACHGINIADGFNHYGTEFKADPRIVIYDGIHFNPKSRYDVVSVISVIHHMPPDTLAEWCSSLYAACANNARVYIKDVDLVEMIHSVTFRYQHYLYEGIMIPGTDYSYMNHKLTFKFIFDNMIAAGFKLVNLKRSPNFNNTFNALFGKN